MSEPYWEPFAQTGGLAYKGDHVPATTYQDGDVVVKDGIAYLCVGGPTTVAPDSTPWGPASLGAIAYGLTLPASPADGQEAILVDSLTAPTYQWRFRYSADISDAYKWVFIGGSSVRHAIPTAEASTAGNGSNPFNLATLGPRIFVPRAGIYEADYGVGEFTCPGATAYAGPIVGIGDFAAAGGVQRALNPIGSGGWTASASGLAEITAAAADEIRVKYIAWNNQNHTYGGRWLSVRPKRVA